MPADELQHWAVAEPYLNLHCQLGEGPYYERNTHSIRFVDIEKKQLHTVSLAKGPSSVSSVTLDETISVTADIEGYDASRKILAGLKSGIAMLDREAGTYEYLARSEAATNPRVRSNDGAVDPTGKFWLGAMTDFIPGGAQPEGSLSRFSGSSPGQLVLSDLTIPNSIGWSLDNKTMYFVRTTTRQILAFDFSLSDSNISNKRVMYAHAGSGYPDGFRVDVQGNIWLAIYGEGRVLRISPNGKVSGDIALPTRNVTCVEFGGTELFITTGEDEDGDAESRELGGALFRLDVGITGRTHFLFKPT
ncbi:regucalcin [Dactylonectria macrodidyma]|uniref:Regucalcin n=1 Tax=Dactylonectria macrodidyma TaxID=307937 RepID=A0A9P9JCX7_9HYPO|nr:regucalcin [Dactylonectria macrodidyma]